MEQLTKEKIIEMFKNCKEREGAILMFIDHGEISCAIVGQIAGGQIPSIINALADAQKSILRPVLGNYKHNEEHYDKDGEIKNG